MNYKRYEIISNLPKIIFSLVLSFIICISIFKSTFYVPLLFVFKNFFYFAKIADGRIFLFFSSAIVSLFIQLSIYSIIRCFVDIWMLDEDYNKNKYIINGELITKELFFKLRILKNIPIFSIFNDFIYLISGKTFLHKIYKIEYNCENKNVFKEKVIRKSIFMFIIIICCQFLFSMALYLGDCEILLNKEIKNMEFVKETETKILVTENEKECIYNLIVYLSDGYINYNKISATKENIINCLKQKSQDLKEKYSIRKVEFVGFNVIIYNEYSKTWDKYVYDENVENSYCLENISNTVFDIDIYKKENILVYNILTDLSRNEIGWDMAEFLLREFEDDIVDKNNHEKIQTVLQDDSEIKKYVINILSKEYYSFENSAYYVYIKNIDDKEWFYYDNEFYTLKSREFDFEILVKENFGDVFLDFKNLYETGEINIITQEEINIDNMYTLLLNSDEGKQLIQQAGYVGDISEIKFVIKEDIS